jgi:hypothetical protein
MGVGTLLLAKIGNGGRSGEGLSGRGSLGPAEHFARRREEREATQHPANQHALPKPGYGSPPGNSIGSNSLSNKANRRLNMALNGHYQWVVRNARALRRGFSLPDRAPACQHLGPGHRLDARGSTGQYRGKRRRALGHPPHQLENRFHLVVVCDASRFLTSPGRSANPAGGPRCCGS